MIAKLNRKNSDGTFWPIWININSVKHIDEQPAGTVVFTTDGKSYVIRETAQQAVDLLMANAKKTHG